MKFWSGLAMAAAATLLTACNSDFNISTSSSGVPLAELDTSGAAPTGISLAGPDRVIVTSGEGLTINVEGDPDVTEGVRFELDGDTLEISREGNWMGSSVATVRVTMPTPTELSLAGSGEIEVDRLGTGEGAEVSIAGSGESRVGQIDADRLEVSVAGSGSLEAAGRVQTLELSIAGSGDLDLRNVTVGDAEVSIAGSGDARFTSNGNVDASIMGSGDVEVFGNANCSVSSMGSGEVRCNRTSARAANTADESREADARAEDSAQ